MAACPSCGAENRAEAQFCDACGARLRGRAEARDPPHGHRAVQRRGRVHGPLGADVMLTEAEVALASGNLASALERTAAARAELAIYAAPAYDAEVDRFEARIEGARS